MQILENIPLAPFTTFRIGGPARWFVEVADEKQLLEAVFFARKMQLPLFVLGGGSNLLVADTGFPGVVVRIALKGIHAQQEEDGAVLFDVAAGEEWDGFVRYAVEQNCAGIECLAGIPGTVGGTPVQNVGAYGQEVSETITRVQALDLETARFVDLSPEQCGFRYRTSIFNSTERERYIVTHVRYRLLPGGAPRIAYADLKKYFDEHQGTPTLREVYDAVRSIRHSKGMVLVEGEDDCRSAGSFFRNPVVAEEKRGEIAAALKIALDAVPHYPAEDGHVKLPAAWLLEKAGFHKGFSLGRAGISSRHTLALINRGDATAADVLALRDCIVAEVEQKFGVRLQPEPVFVD
ncbi:MAG: UDP-N-acetylmuramate dehydrogenase [Acidobacteriaceae bacterium]